MEIGYSDFVALCRVNDPDDWGPGLAVRRDGVYIKEPKGPLPPSVRASLTEGHPTGNLAEPALKFPCSLKAMQIALDELGMNMCIDPFDMADWARKQSAKTSSKSSEPPSVRLAVAALLDLLIDSKPKKRNQASVIQDIIDRHPDVRGLSERTLDSIFSSAKQALREAKT